VAIDDSGAFLGALVLQAVGGANPAEPVILGWLDDRTVLILADEDGFRPILAWDIHAGTFSLVSSLAESVRLALPEMR